MVHAAKVWLGASAVNRVAWGLLFALALATGGCATRKTRGPVGPRPEEGIASYYAAFFAGRRTASGEIYRPSAMTAAHRTLPFGTLVRVTRIDPHGAPLGSPILVRINDRGPYASGRIIDLSSTAAHRLGIKDGLARVRLEIVNESSRP